MQKEGNINSTTDCCTLTHFRPERVEMKAKKPICSVVHAVIRVLCVLESWYDPSFKAVRYLLSFIILWHACFIYQWDSLAPDTKRRDKNTPWFLWHISRFLAWLLCRTSISYRVCWLVGPSDSSVFILSTHAHTHARTRTHTHTLGTYVRVHTPPKGADSGFAGIREALESRNLEF